MTRKAGRPGVAAPAAATSAASEAVVLLMIYTAGIAQHVRFIRQCACKKRGDEMRVGPRRLVQVVCALALMVTFACTAACTALPRHTSCLEPVLWLAEPMTAATESCCCCSDPEVARVEAAWSTSP